MRKRSVQGVQSGMVGTSQCSQWGSEQGWWCKLNQREEVVVEWDLASGTNCDIVDVHEDEASSCLGVHVAHENLIQFCCFLLSVEMKMVTECYVYAACGGGL